MILSGIHGQTHFTTWPGNSIPFSTILFSSPFFFGRFLISIKFFGDVVMNNKNKAAPRALLIVLFLGVFAARASGYVDPGTGSYILQIAIAFLVGLLFSIKVFWKKITAFFGKLFSKKGKDAGHAS